jgi:hypothetical protein
MYSWQQKRGREGRRRQRRRSKMSLRHISLRRFFFVRHTCQYIAIYCFPRHLFLASISSAYLLPVSERYWDTYLSPDNDIYMSLSAIMKTDCSLAQCLHLLRNGLRQTLRPSAWCRSHHRLPRSRTPFS